MFWTENRALTRQSGADEDRVACRIVLNETVETDETVNKSKAKALLFGRAFVRHITNSTVSTVLTVYLAPGRHCQR